MRSTATSPTGMEAAIDRLEDDPEVWVAVLPANSEGQARPVFCAGADLKAINAGDAARLNTAKRRLRRLRLPRAHQTGDRRRRRARHRRRL